MLTLLFRQILVWTVTFWRVTMGSWFLSCSVTPSVSDLLEADLMSFLCLSYFIDSSIFNLLGKIIRPFVTWSTLSLQYPRIPLAHHSLQVLEWKQLFAIFAYIVYIFLNAFFVFPCVCFSHYLEFSPSPLIFYNVMNSFFAQFSASFFRLTWVPTLTLCLPFTEHHLLKCIKVFAFFF